MAEKKPEIDLAKEVDREVFINVLKGQIEIAQSAIEKAERTIKSFVNLYNKIQVDACHYNLKYYVVGDGLTYERIKRKKIGF